VKRSMELLKKAVTLTHILVTVAAPLLFCTVGGLWLCRRFHLGRGFMALFILLGVASSLWSLWKWLKPFLQEDRDETLPTSFNDHY